MDEAEIIAYILIYLQRSLPMRKMNILTAFKKKFLLNLLLVTLLFVIISIFSFINLKYSYESQNLINILGSQRYKIQQLSKEVYKIHIFLDLLDDNSLAQASDDNLKSLKESQQKLFSIRSSFSDTLNSVNNGYVYNNHITINLEDSSENISEPLSDINRLWESILPSIVIMENASTTNDEVINASLKIGNSTDSFVNSINSINSIIIDNFKHKAYIRFVIVAILALISFAGMLILWANLYKNILQPMDALFTNISKIGINNSTADPLTETNSKSLKPLVEEVNEAFDKLDSLIDLIENINKSSSFKEILEYIYYSFTPFIPFTYIGIALIEDNGTSLKAAYAISDDTINGPSPAGDLLGFKTHLDGTSLINVIKTGKPRIINDLERYNENRPLKLYNKIILDAGIRSSITLPIKHNNEAVGIIFFSSKQKNSYTKEHAHFLMTIANSIAIAFEKNIFIKDIILSSIIALAKLAESRDEDTGDHLNRMSAYSETIAELLYKKSKYREEITPEFIDDIEKFSPLHDIGKVGIADKILLKPGKLTYEEFQEMKKHTIYGGEVLRAANKSISKEGISPFTLGIEIAENHHEKWDGSGYPKGLSGEDIPLSARIVAVADVFDALTSRRPYKEPFPIDVAFNMLEEGSGKHFDPEIIKIVLEKRSVIIDLYNKFKPKDDNEKA
jgi:response regulator RpfG family c-di-GMP phosphodiesterase